VEGIKEGTFVLVTEEDNIELLICSLVGNIGTFDGLEGRACLLHDPAHNSISCSATLVVGGLSVVEPFECWVSLNIVGLSTLLVCSSINLGDVSRGIFLGKNLGSLGIFWLKLLAMATPRSIELNEEILVLCNFSIEVGISKNENTFVILHSKGNG